MDDRPIRVRHDRGYGGRVAGPDAYPAASARVAATVLAAVLFTAGVAGSIEFLTLPAALAFGALVRRPWALLVAFVPFLLVISHGGGDSGDPPGWVVALVFEVPMLALMVGGGVVAGRLVERIPGRATR
jgi:hypothetical protein